MRRLFLATVLALLGAAPAAATCSGPGLLDRLTAEERADFDATVAAIPYGEGLFWRAERDGAEVILAGTMHLSDPRLGPVFERIGPEVAAADLVLLEMTPAERDRMERALVEEPERMFLTEGPTLPEMLDEATWSSVADAARARGIPPFMASKFRPWFLMVSLAMPPCALEAAAGPGGLDEMLMDEALRAGTPMRALEPWDTIFDLFETGTMDEQLDLLRFSLLGPDLQEAALVTLLDGYFAGRIGEVWQSTRLSLDLVPGLESAEADALFALTEEQLLGARNRAWIPVIEEAAAEHRRILVAAGAAHLPGEEGVLALLAGRGWTVERIE